MWSYKSYIGRPIDPIFLNLGLNSTSVYPHELKKNEKLGGFTAPFNLKFNPEMVFNAFNLWHSSAGVNTSGTIHNNARITFRDTIRRSFGFSLTGQNRGLATVINDIPILCGDLVAMQNFGFYRVLAAVGEFDVKKVNWMITTVMASPQQNTSNLASLPHPNELTELEYNATVGLFSALGAGLDADKSLATAINNLASANKAYLDGITTYLSTAVAGSPPTTLTPPISTILAALNTAYNNSVNSINNNTSNSNNSYEEKIKEAKDSQEFGYNIGRGAP